MFLTLMRYQQGDSSDDVLYYLNHIAIAVYQQRYIYCMNQCKTKESAKVFNDWWEDNEHVFSDEYKENVNQDDYNDAYEWIMESIALGMG